MADPKKPAPPPAVAAGGSNWPPLDTELVEVDPRSLRGQDVNARFMTAAQMAQLTDNMRRDGAITSAVLIYRAPGTEVDEILSGHHRAQAAVGAELALIPAIRITTPLTDAQKTAIQLSHNAITGQDDPSTLAQMYAGLDLSAKSYSGLDESVLDVMSKVQLAGLGLSIKYQEMTLFFLDEDAAVVLEALPKLEKAGRNSSGYVTRYADWEEFFALMVRAKSKFQVFNSGIAFRMLIDLAAQGLDALEAADVGSDA